MASLHEQFIEDVISFTGLEMGGFEQDGPIAHSQCPATVRDGYQPIPNDKGLARFSANPLFYMASPGGFEPPLPP